MTKEILDRKSEVMWEWLEELNRTIKDLKRRIDSIETHLKEDNKEDHMREDRKKKLTNTMFHMAELWMVCNNEEKEIVRKKFEKFMKDIVNTEKEDI